MEDSNNFIDKLIDNFSKESNNLSVKELIILIDKKINDKYDKINYIKNYIFVKFNYDKFISIKEELNKKYKLSENEKDKQTFKEYLISDYHFNYNKFNEYYNNKIIFFQIKSINHLININSIVDFDVSADDFRKKIGIHIFHMTTIFEELNKINRFLKYYNKKYKHISLINFNFVDCTDFYIMKKILGCIFFKNIIIKYLYSKIKKFRKLFFKYQNLLNELDNKFNIIEFNNTFKFYNYIYNKDKIISSGEKYIDKILLDIYNNNPSLLYYEFDYVLPVKFLKSLRADFFCIFINKNKEIKKLIIEVNGNQHYVFNKFFNDKTLITRDNIKKDFCKKYNIEFIELRYNELTQFSSIMNKLLY